MRGHNVFARTGASTTLFGVVRWAMWTVCAITLAIAYSGCGKDAGSAAVAPAAANPGVASGLGTRRFEVLDAVYVAALPFDSIKQGERSKLAAATPPLTAACDALDAHDPLLGAIRASCRLAAQFNAKDASDACVARRSARCVQSYDGLRRILRKLIRRSHQADRVIRESDLTRKCREALAGPARADEVYVGFYRVLGLLKRATTTASIADHQRSQRLNKRIVAIQDKLPNGAQSLTLFRSACA